MYMKKVYFFAIRMIIIGFIDQNPDTKELLFLRKLVSGRPEFGFKIRESILESLLQKLKLRLPWIIN